MKFEWNRKFTTIAAYAFIVLALAILFFHFVWNFAGVMGWFSKLLNPIYPIFLGFAIAYLLNPIMCAIEYGMEKCGLRALLLRTFKPKYPKKLIRNLSLLLTYLLTLAILTLFAFIVLPQVFSSVRAMATQMQEYVAYAQRTSAMLLEKIPEGMVPQDVINQVSSMVGKAVSDSISLIGSSVPQMVSIAMNIGSGIISAIMGIIVSCYLLASKEKFMAQLRKVAFAFMSPGEVSRWTEITHTTDNMFGRFITGKIIDSLIIGVLCFIGMSLMKMPNAVLISFIVGVTNVIPYFGPFLGAIPSFFLIAFISPPKALIFVVFIVVLQQIDGNIIGPLILGDSTGLSAFWVIFAILFFGGAFGIFGMFIGVPTFGVIYWLIKTKIAVTLAEKSLPTQTEHYLQHVEDIRQQSASKK